MMFHWKNSLLLGKKRNKKKKLGEDAVLQKLKVAQWTWQWTWNIQSLRDDHAPVPTTTTPPPESAPARVMDEFEHEEELMDEDEGVNGFGTLAGGKEMEITTEKLLRKTTVFYRERMNPETLNKLAVILSSEKIYETLKIKIEEVARAATDTALEIDKDVPIVEVIPEFPGCVCVPSMQKINAEKEYDVASFLITPLQTGEILMRVLNYIIKEY